MKAFFEHFGNLTPNSFMREAYWGGGILHKILLKYFPTCSDFKTTTNSISSKCKLSTSSTTLFN